MCCLRNIALESVTDGRTDRRTDGQTDRQTDKVIPMCRYASQATQKLSVMRVHSTGIVHSPPWHIIMCNTGLSPRSKMFQFRNYYAMCSLRIFSVYIVDFAQSFNIRPKIMSISANCTQCISLLSMPTWLHSSFHLIFVLFPSSVHIKFPHLAVAACRLRTLVSPRHSNSVVPSTMVLSIKSAYIIDNFLSVPIFWVLMSYIRFVIFLNVQLLSNFPVVVMLLSLLQPTRTVSL